MTACEALLFCSRAAGVSEEDKAAIAADWADELAELLPDSLYSWAAEEMAVCLETGILSVTELRALSADDGLLKTISRESLAMYLVRAMQLDAMAKNLSTYPMDFADTNSISAALQPYVYLLDTYGIVRGNEANCFLPKSSLTRAEMATMLPAPWTSWRSGGSMPSCPPTPTTTGWGAPSPRRRGTAPAASPSP